MGQLEFDRDGPKLKPQHSTKGPYVKPAADAPLVVRIDAAAAHLEGPWPCPGCKDGAALLREYEAIAYKILRAYTGPDEPPAFEPEDDRPFV